MYFYLSAFSAKRIRFSASHGLFGHIGEHLRDVLTAVEKDMKDMRTFCTHSGCCISAIGGLA